MTHIKTHPDAAPIEVPKDSKVSADPIAGGICIINAAVPPGEDGHEVWRTLTAAEKTERQEIATKAVAFRRADALLFLRLKRNAMLRATDWLEANLPNSPPVWGKWAAWRQALRDLPATVADPEFPAWPSPPQPISALLEWRALWPDLAWNV